MLKVKNEVSPHTARIAKMEQMRREQDDDVYPDYELPGSDLFDDDFPEEPFLDEPVTQTQTDLRNIQRPGMVLANKTDRTPAAQSEPPAPSNTPKRRFGPPSLSSTTQRPPSPSQELPTRPVATVPVVPVPPPTGLVPSGSRVRLSADIDQDLHTRLKFHSFRTRMSLVRILEGWIREHCPEA